MKFIRFALVLLFVIILPLVAFASPDMDEPPLTIRYAAQQTVDGENAVGITFSQPLDPTQPLAPYFSIFTEDDTPVEGGWILSKDHHIAYFTHVEPRTTYKIQVNKGIKSQVGHRLEDGGEFTVKTRGADPMIRFESNGFLLPATLTRGLPVASVNINRADIDFFRVKADALPRFREFVSRQDLLYTYDTEALADMADLVYTGRWDLEVRPNLRTQVNLPITHIKALKAPGIYLAVLRGAGVYDYRYSRIWFTISDLGLSLRQYSQSLTVQVQGLETAKPVPGVSLTGMDEKGRELFIARTDDRGTATLEGRFPQLATLIARKKGHTSILPVDLPALDLSEFKAATAPFRPISFFVYGPRNLYRPGETVVTQGLLRDQDGRMTPVLPVKAKIFRPDGRMVHEFTWKGTGLSHYQNRYVLPGDAMTGNWRMDFSRADTPLGQYTFLVSDFLPERLSLILDNPPGQTDVLTPDHTLKLALEGAFLYGAPAANIPADAMVQIRPARELFPDSWPGYDFTGPDSDLDFGFSTETIRLDKDGKGILPVGNQWKEDIKSPHRVTVNASLHDTSGRPVNRKKSWQIWPAKTLVGIRSLAGEEGIAADSLAQFDLILVDDQGKTQKAKGLKAKIIREHREYFWEFVNGSWKWDATHHFFPLDEFNLDISSEGPARIQFPVEHGGYRLEITHPATGLVTVKEIWAGWQPRDNESRALNRPDRVDISLDKRAYGPGETARVTLKSPEGGRGYLFVESDSPLFSRAITLPPEGKTFNIKIDPTWNRHDLYVSALVIRPGERRTTDLPKRSVGLVHLPLDRENRRLALEIQVPDKVRPNRTLQVPVRVQRADGSIPANARITLAAVDEGILGLTRFKTPNPFHHFFQPREYGVEISDIYQKLIESNDGAQAVHRFGGDAPGLTRGGDRPATDVQIVALSTKALAVDKEGVARFNLDLPEFNGRLRLMAVAHTESEFGSRDRDITLASPLVTQMAMPRFLATGDQSRLVLDLHNLSGLAQNLTLAVTLQGPLALTGPARQEIRLTRDEKRSLILPVKALEAPGRARIQVQITGLEVEDKPVEIQRSWFLETRSPYPPQTRALRQRLAPGETFTLAPDQIKDLTPATCRADLTLDTIVPLNLAAHIRELRAYPYGCLEQTTSGIFPHVLLSDADLARLGIAPDPETPEKIRLGIQRLLEKQKAGGSFGLWNARDDEEPWLTAYTTHFLVMAAQAGYEVPMDALKRSLKRLLTYVRRPRSIPVRWGDRQATRASVRAYSAMVLAMTQNLTLGDARSTARAITPHIQTSLAHVHMGMALLLAGDANQARASFHRAVLTRRGEKARYMDDYGSDIRDFAMAYALLDQAPDFNKRALFLHELNALLPDRRWLSTQERNALVMAGAARLRAPQTPWTADLVLGESKTRHLDREKQVTFNGEKLAQGLRLTNTGKDDLFLGLMVSGYPVTMPQPFSEYGTLVRQYLDMNGSPLSGEELAALEPGDRLIVGLALRTDQAMPHALVVDLLPAGLEPMDPRLAHTPDIGPVKVEGKTISNWQERSPYMAIEHTEYRDDRFVAAVALSPGKPQRLFYAVTVVSPGRFKTSPPMVEDMYLPEFRILGPAGPNLVIAPKK